MKMLLATMPMTKYVDADELLRRYAAGEWKFSNVNLRSANLRGANLRGTDLSHADLSNADLHGANLSGADLYRANLSGTNLCWASLSGADLYGTDLRRADLYKCNLYGANLYGADLSHVDLSNADLRRANLSEAILPDGRTEQQKTIKTNSRSSCSNPNSYIQPLVKTRDSRLGGEAGNSRDEVKDKALHSSLLTFPSSPTPAYRVLDAPKSNRSCSKVIKKSSSVTQKRIPNSGSTSGLLEDLAKYADEAFTKNDLEAGLKLIGEIVGLISFGSLAMTVLTGWLPAVGITLTPVMVYKIIAELAKAYLKLSAAQRKQVRVAVRWIKGGVNLGELFTNFNGNHL